MGLNREFWKNRKVLLTGHTGFKGSWLSIWLQELGANVVGISLDPPTQPSLFEAAHVAKGMKSLKGDIRDLDVVLAAFREFQPEVVIHMAAQPLVRYSYQHPVETYGTNVMGTLHVLEGIRSISTVRAAVMVTTDKCYDLKDASRAQKETDPLGGHDPYSSSKGCAEILIASYRDSYFSNAQYATHRTAIASVRAGNVIGGGDWAADRLIPDIVRAFQAGQPVEIRNPAAVRPWQHLLEPLTGYMMLAEKLWTAGPEFAEAWNFGPEDGDAKPVQWIVETMARMWGNSDWKLDKGEHPHEAPYLKLDCAKAKARLNWIPQWGIEQALVKIVEWNRDLSNGRSAHEICLSQIREHSN